MCGDFGLNIATLHLGAMMSPDTGADVPEIHAGKDETSVMLVLAPELVRREAMATLKPSPGGEAVRALVFDPAASYPWSSDDPRLSASGIMGDARGASAAHGETIVARVLEGAGAVIRRLKDNAAVKQRPGGEEDLDALRPCLWPRAAAVMAGAPAGGRAGHRQSRHRRHHVPRAHPVRPRHRRARDERGAQRRGELGRDHPPDRAYGASSARSASCPASWSRCTRIGCRIAASSPRSRSISSTC